MIRSYGVSTVAGDVAFGSDTPGIYYINFTSPISTDYFAMANVYGTGSGGRQISITKSGALSTNLLVNTANAAGTATTGLLFSALIYG